MCNAPQDVTDMSRPNTSHGNSMVIHPLGRVLDEADSFEERLVHATVDMGAADGSHPACCGILPAACPSLLSGSGCLMFLEV